MKEFGLDPEDYGGTSTCGNMGSRRGCLDWASMLVCYVAAIGVSGTRSAPTRGRRV